MAAGYLAQTPVKAVLGIKRIVRAFQNIQNFEDRVYSSSYLDFSAAPPKFLNQLTDSFVKSLLLIPADGARSKDFTKEPVSCADQFKILGGAALK